MEEQIQRNAAEAATAQENDSPRGSVAHALGVQQTTAFPSTYPGGITPDTLFDARTERIIRAQADRLVTTGLFEQHEREDVENELRIVLACEMAKFDPAKDRYTFAATVLAKRGTNAIIKRGNYLRDNPRPLSLDEPVNGESGETFLDIIPAESREPADVEELEKRLEKRDKCVAGFLDSLCELDHKICDLMMEGRSIRSVAAILGLTHTGVRYRLGRDIAEKAAEFGLEQFVEVAE